MDQRVQYAEHSVQKPPKRLLDQVREVVRFKHYALSMEKTYISWIRRYISLHGMRHPGLPIRSILIPLAIGRVHLRQPFPMFGNHLSVFCLPCQIRPLQVVVIVIVEFFRSIPVPDIPPPL